MTVSDPPRETTEWEDTLRKFGILAPLPPQPKEVLPTYSSSNNASNSEKLHEAHSVKQLDALEDAFDDDKFMEEYRKKRIAEMKAEAAEARQPVDVKAIKKDQWKEEITDAGDTFVLVHLYQERVPACRTVQEISIKLAKKFRSVKFLQIIADQAIPNYPDRNLPTLLLYHRGDPVAQLVGPAQIPSTISVDDIELWLALKGAVESDLANKKDVSIKSQTRSEFVGAKKKNKADGSDDEDDDDED